jgi:predicted DNA-binding protein
MAIKVTFTLDEGTVTKLNRTAERLSKPKSEVVQEAVAEYYEKAGRLSEAERTRMLGALRKISRTSPACGCSVPAGFDKLKNSE